MRKIIVLIVLVLNGIILLYSCKKEDKEEEPEYDKVTSEDNALAEAIFTDVNTIVNQAVENGSAGLSTYRMGSNQNSILSTCATVSVNQDTSGGGTIVVNFGSSFCQCLDGRYRKGIINIEYSGAYRDSGTHISASLDNYYVGLDSTNLVFKIDGTKTVTNNGRNNAGNLNYSISVTGHITNTGGAVMDWTSTRNREWTGGESTILNWSDDEYLITGSTNATNFEGTSYSAVITSGLHIKLDCHYIIQGTFDLTPSGKPTRTFDFGNGLCDNRATVSINGTVFPITLR